MSQSRKPSLLERFRSMTGSRGPSPGPRPMPDNSSMQEELKEEKERKDVSFDTLLEFQQVQDEMFCASLEDSDSLQPFSKAYGNTLKGHKEQLDRDEFKDPEQTTKFAIEFARKYLAAKEMRQREKELLVDPYAEDEDKLDTSSVPSYGAWKETEEKARYTQDLPLPKWARSGLVVKQGAKTHIEEDLVPSLQQVRKDNPTGSLDDLDEDFTTAGKPFEENTRRTGRELGIPGPFTWLGGKVTDVKGMRDKEYERFKQGEQ